MNKDYGDLNLFDFASAKADYSSLNPIGKEIAPSKQKAPAPYSPTVSLAESKRIQSNLKSQVPKPSPSINEEVLSDEDLKALVDEGATDEEIVAIEEQMRNERKVPSDKASMTQPIATTEEVPKEGGFGSFLAERAKETTVDPLRSVAANVPRIASNLASLPLDIVGGRYFGEEVPQATSLASKIRKKGEELTSTMEGDYGFDETKAGFGRAATDIGSALLIPGGQVGKAGSVGEAIKGANIAKNVVADVGLKLAPIATRGVIDAAKYSAVSEGRLPTTGEAVVGAAITPVANMAKSLPGIRGITGKSEILNAGSVRPGTVTGKPTALYDKAGKLLGTESQLQTSASRLYGATGDAYDVNNAIAVARKFSPEEIAALKNSQNPAKDAAYLADAKQKGLYEIAKDVTKANTTPIPVESLGREVAGKVRNPVKEGISLLKGKERELVDDDLVKLSNIEGKVNSNSPLTLDEIHEFSVLMGKYSGNFYDGFAKDAGYELTRKGVKDLVYKFGGKELGKVDDEISSLIDARTNWRKIDESVTATKAKYGNGIALEVAKFFSNLINTGGNLTKATARTGVGSGQAKVSAFDAVDFSSQLGKNLKKINELTKGLEKSRTEEEALSLINRLKQESNATKNVTLPLLPSGKNTVQSANVVNVSPIALPSSITKSELSRAVIRNPQKASEEAFKKGLEEGKKTIKKPSPKPTKPAIKKNVPKKKPMKI